ncbi:MAG: PA14 domain-containing protein, partial [Phycisphaerales bacterium]
DWQPEGVPTDIFSVRWSGALLVPTSGFYDFEMQSDDRANLYIDGRLLFSSNTGTEERGPFYLEAGTRLIGIDLREFGGEQRMRLRWRPSSTPDWSPLGGEFYRPVYDGDADGITDICESGDCNANLVPDGFELAEGLDLDCNSNGSLDSCDIAAGAVDCNGNGVLDSCEASVPGLVGRYYPRLGSDQPSDPYRPGKLAAVRRDRDIAFNEGSWQPTDAPGDNLIAIWTGALITGPEAGLYRFKTESDDGCRVYIDGVAVIDRWLQNAGEGFGEIELAANTAYDFRMEFHEGIGGQYARLKWKAPSASAKSPYELVPGSAFRMATPDCNANGVPDDCDIANGTLPDPGAGIPDPCDAAPCTGDLNGSGTVDAADLATLLGAWGTAGSDLNSDGTTNASDLALLLGNWGPCN